MSNKEALQIFVRKHVTTEMVDYLVDVTESIIKVKEPESDVESTIVDELYPSPPSSPKKKLISLKSFIINLIRYSNVQVPTLMATLVYLNRLKEILPSDQIYGIPTTHHRIFVGCLILTAKYVNDSSPLNKHWARYSSGLLSVKELNVIEVEVLSYLDWELTISEDDLYDSLSHFLTPIRQKLRIKQLEEQQMKMATAAAPSTTFKTLKNSASINSIKKMLCPPPSATSSTFSENSMLSAMSTISPVSSISSLSSPAKNTTMPSLTNSASTYQTQSTNSSTYSLNNSSTSSLTKKIMDEDFNFVEPPSYTKSIFQSPKNLLMKLTTHKSPKTTSQSPQLYRIASNSSLRSNTSTNRLMSPINNFKLKLKNNKNTSKLQNSESFSVVTSTKCLAQPPNIYKNDAVSVSTDNLRHFNLKTNV